jgi:DUF4097 and DUF4098 domain-containing protein YvlB
MLTALLMATMFALPTASPALDTTLRVAPNSRIAIIGVDQPIQVTGTTGTQLRVSGAAVHTGGDGITIGTLSDDGEPIVVHLPVTSRLRIDATSGSVTVTNAPQLLEITAIDGQVQVSGGTGRMRVSSIGGIAVRNFRGGRLSLEGLAGPISVTGATGVIEIENVSGPIELRDVVSNDVRVTATDGPIRWRGDFAPTGRYRFETHDGGIELTVPRSFDAQLQLTSFDGGLATEIPATITRNSGERGDWIGERRTTAVWRQGRATIDITSFDGGVTVRALP